MEDDRRHVRGERALVDPVRIGGAARVDVETPEHGTSLTNREILRRLAVPARFIVERMLPLPTGEEVRDDHRPLSNLAGRKLG